LGGAVLLPAIRGRPDRGGRPHVGALLLLLLSTSKVSPAETGGHPSPLHLPDLSSQIQIQGKSGGPTLSMPQLPSEFCVSKSGYSYSAEGGGACSSEVGPSPHGFIARPRAAPRHSSQEILFDRGERLQTGVSYSSNR